MATRVFLCRHGEPEPGARERFCGRLDVGLSPWGAEQARALAAALDGEAVAAIYASPRRRSLETARTLAAPQGLPVVELEALSEIDFGELDGLRLEEAERRFPDVYRLWLDAPARVRFPGGESYADVAVRATEALAGIVRRHPQATVAAVSHGGPLRAMLAACLLVPDEAVFRICVDYGRVSLVEWVDGTALVRSLNALPT
jgi:broad specificity phosphatase PhoE